MPAPDIQQQLATRPGSQDWASQLGQMLNPIPLLQAIGRIPRNIGVEGANAGLDMLGVPGYDPPRGGVQDTIDSWLGMAPRPQTADEAQEQQLQTTKRGIAIDHAQAMKEIAREGEPAESRPAASLPPGIQGQTSPAQLQALMRMMGVQR